MMVSCPHCGGGFEVRGKGRKPLALTVTTVCDAIGKGGNVPAAAEKLDVSRGYIYKVLKTAGLLAKDFVVGKRTRGPAKRFSRKATKLKAADIIKRK